MPGGATIPIAIGQGPIADKTSVYSRRGSREEKGSRGRHRQRVRRHAKERGKATIVLLRSKTEVRTNSAPAAARCDSPEENTMDAAKDSDGSVVTLIQDYITRADVGSG